MIVGTDGQLGWELGRLLVQDGAQQIVALGRAALDVADRRAVERGVEKSRPEVVINCAAFTDVDGCEDERERAFLVNATGAHNVARAAHRVGAKLVHISTDYVFAGDQSAPRVETDPTVPINVYGASKLEGEQRVQEACPEHFIVRTAWLYGLHGKNFVKTMVRLGKKGEPINVVNDQHGSPTWTRDLAKQIKRLFPAAPYGTYYASSQGHCTWYEFTLEIFRQLGVKTQVSPVLSEHYVQPAGRPKNGVMDNARLKALGLDVMPPWQEGLKQFLQELSGSPLSRG